MMKKATMAGSDLFGYAFCDYLPVDVCFDFLHFARPPRLRFLSVLQLDLTDSSCHPNRMLHPNVKSVMRTRRSTDARPVLSDSESRSDLQHTALNLDSCSVACYKQHKCMQRLAESYLANDSWGLCGTHKC